MKNNYIKILVTLLLVVTVVMPVLSLFGVGNVYAATNTKSGTASDIVAVASAQKHGSDGWEYIRYVYKDGQYHQWCASFVSWCANQAGAGKIIPKNGGCKYLYKNIINAGGSVVTKPKAGDIIFYHRTGTAAGEFCHVGIVTKVSKTSVTTVQGNIKQNEDGSDHGIVQNTLEATKFSRKLHNSLCAS